jgi:hypothetical protein
MICNECVAPLVGQLTEKDRAGLSTPPEPEEKTVKTPPAEFIHVDRRRLRAFRCGRSLQQ